MSHIRAVLRYDLPKHEDQAHLPAPVLLAAPNPADFDKNYVGVALRLIDYRILLSANTLHTGEQRQSRDLDFVVVEQITSDEFLGKGYTVDQYSGKKFTPRGYKIDVYEKRDLNNIPLEYITNTAVAIPVDKKGITVNVITLEGLVITKFRAGRDQDIEDLRRLAVHRRSKINWNEIRHLTKSNTEYSQIEQALRLYAAR